MVEREESSLTQAQIARLIGRSQPEVSRLLRFHGRCRPATLDKVTASR